jgi:hypothetical protein
MFQSDVPMKLVSLIKPCLNETYSTLQVGKHLSDPFCIKHGLKEGDALLQLFCHSTLGYAIGMFKQMRTGPS